MPKFIRFSLLFFLVSFAVPSFSADPEYTSIKFEMDFSKPAEEVWAKIGGYCDIAEWLEIDCVITSGDGGIGTVRKLVGGRVTEIMVALTDLSYGYGQPAVEGEFYNHYHGFMEVKPVSDSSSKILYTLVYDASNLNAEEAEADISRRRALIGGGIANMKKLVEAPE